MLIFHFHGCVQVRVQLPALLKQKLVEDWQRAERGDELALPRKPSISDILQQYVDSTRGARDSVEAEEEVANGLRIYFDKALQQLLLYATEQDLAAKVGLALCTPAQPASASNYLEEALCSSCRTQRSRASQCRQWHVVRRPSNPLFDSMHIVSWTGLSLARHVAIKEAD